ncbi:MAG: aminoacyl-tRNA hydrolase [Desulfovibrio sp.]|jgi:PTH1 family peptidyl-tRNA hydrolase|nr:aminoacyl-tRNA hydrolase [Desulfovibrio sp.]
MEYKGALIGLGNPGCRYAGTRHNMGFLLVSALLEQAGREGRLAELNGSRFACELHRIHLSQLGGVWLAAKPLTFMNESGRCVQPLLAWHKLAPSRLVVAHDELDIPAGELRFKRAGGNAGHNGLKSIAECLGTQDFFRLRMGIGRPPHKGDALNWVLGRPDEADAGLLLAALPRALDVLFAFAGTGLEAAARLARH